MKTHALALLVLSSCVIVAADDPSLLFSEKKVDAPSLSLITDSQPKEMGIMSPSLAPFHIQKRAKGVDDKFVIVPRDDVDYKMIIKEPDPTIDYKMIVKRWESR